MWIGLCCLCGRKLANDTNRPDLARPPITHIREEPGLGQKIETKIRKEGTGKMSKGPISINNHSSENSPVRRGSGVFPRHPGFHPSWRGQAPRGNSFEKTVLRPSLPVLLDFWSPWCAPCLITANTGGTGQGTRAPPPGEQVQCDRGLSHARPVRHHGHPHPDHFQGWQRGGAAGGGVSQARLERQTGGGPVASK